MCSEQDMLELAKLYRSRAYAPYSKYQVAVVLRGANGKLYGGCNVENIAYPVGNCAEASAIAAMIGDGETRIAEALVIGPEGDLCTPCGACRQRLREFADDSLVIHVADPSGVKKSITLGELLPLSFGPEILGRP